MGPTVLGGGIKQENLVAERVPPACRVSEQLTLDVQAHQRSGPCEGVGDRPSDRFPGTRPRLQNRVLAAWQPQEFTAGSLAEQDVVVRQRNSVPERRTPPERSSLDRAQVLLP